MQLSVGTWWLTLPLLAVAPMALLVLVTGMLCLLSPFLSERRRAHVLDMLRLMVCLAVVIASSGGRSSDRLLPARRASRQAEPMPCGALKVLFERFVLDRPPPSPLTEDPPRHHRSERAAGSASRSASNPDGG
jgi:hypothetical protein